MWRSVREQGAPHAQPRWFPKLQLLFFSAGGGDREKGFFGFCGACRWNGGVCVYIYGGVGVVNPRPAAVRR